MHKPAELHTTFLSGTLNLNSGTGSSSGLQHTSPTSQPNISNLLSTLIGQLRGSSLSFVYSSVSKYNYKSLSWSFKACWGANTFAYRVPLHLLFHRSSVDWVLTCTSVRQTPHNLIKRVFTRLRGRSFGSACVVLAITALFWFSINVLVIEKQ